MDKKIKRKFGEITLNLLEEIARMTEGIAYAFLDQAKIKRLLKYGGKFESERFFDYIRGLKRYNYIETKKQNNSLSVRLTDKGRIKLLENSRENKKDGKWRFLSFDIPEKLRKKRDGFRSAIKRIGFKQVQKSLWACPYIKADQIEKVINYYNLNKFVAYFIIEKTDIKKYLQKLFKPKNKLLN
ncbi:hypothetical protein KJ713_03395 [Patescibacteria group bacterium]|nr:hypothetical protein [Patescibacteria group bacterium]